MTNDSCFQFDEDNELKYTYSHSHHILYVQCLQTSLHDDANDSVMCKQKIIIFCYQMSDFQINMLVNHFCLTHWGRVTHIYVSTLTIIGLDNGLSPGLHQAMIRTNAGILSIGPLGTNFSEILLEIYTFSFTKMHWKMSSGKWQPFCLSLNVLISVGNDDVSLKCPLSTTCHLSPVLTRLLPSKRKLFVPR